MENQEISPKQIMLNYGLMLGFASILISVANYALGDAYKPHWSIQVLGLFAMFALITLGLKNLKDNNNGLLSLSQSLKTGVGIAFVSTLIFLIYFYAFTNFIEPTYVDNVIEVNRQNTLDNAPQVTDEMLDMQAEMTKKYFYVFALGGVLFFNLFIGFIISLIAGLIMKKSNEEITSI